MNDRDDKHNDQKGIQEAVEWSPAEKQALEMLPLERIPNADLEDRVVGALRHAGLLVPPRRRVIELTARRVAAAVAAAVVLLAGGFALGQWAGARRPGGSDFTAREASDISTAATLQRAGSAYVLALQRFADLPDSADGDQAAQGREVALTTLYKAADQATRLVPKDELARQLLVAISTDAEARNAGLSGVTTIDHAGVIDF